jgi:hypothetical protein
MRDKERERERKRDDTKGGSRERERDEQSRAKEDKIRRDDINLQASMCLVRNMTQSPIHSSAP